MRIAVFNSKKYDKLSLAASNVSAGSPHQLEFFKPRLDSAHCRLAHGFEAVCVFVNDQCDREIVDELAAHGCKLILLRCAGFNNVDLNAAAERGITVTRVPVYSPYAVAEHAVALIQSLNRHIVKAHNRVREGNFSLDGLLGFDLHGKTVGVCGTGGIGLIFAKIMHAFGCNIIAYDPYKNDEIPKIGKYVELDEFWASSDIISMHVPLMPSTRHMISEEAIAKMKPGVMIINTARGALLDTKAVIQGLKSKQIGALGIDVIEGEEGLFFEDHTEDMVDNDYFHRLCTFQNVLVTGHMAFFTKEALSNIATTTMESALLFEQKKSLNVRNVCCMDGKKIVG
mmetsp:Transcript_20804/g.48617  ORF Transcript_20804/g.48617 Transcript_20804/m.48617 type:complete len:341 (+) Transcript_20804:58-1080(+)|eukprot:CAMPEP_0114551872 /NCGR_PEP_ID=MMETSP0114-20121206/6829_1 /TAXON_ID=31324 /ORGANISM="Goniomonas sp, Strain m" /LENGTH=340 /DNA_ID=CAMNT_0001736723 /DNA_START=45 /DNA_END=1067 /DNA_ORIENTATION=+